MVEKRIYGRLVQKHDTQVNWEKATNFTPMAGELIVYDIDDNYDYERIKIGDGSKNVNALPFVDDALRDALVDQINAVDDKVDAVSTLVGDTAVSEQITTAVETKADIANGQYAVTASSSDGVAYTATVPSITALTSGVSFIMIPGKTSASTTPTLNVNGLGAKNIRRRLSNLATAVQAGYTTTWLAVNRPFRVTYDGTQWIVEGHEKPVGADLYGAAAKATADANGNVITDTYATIAALQALLPKVTSITLTTSWSGTASPYYQDVALNCCTEASMVDIQPTPEQLASWQDDGFAFTTLSGTGTVRVYVAGGKPTEAITVQVKVQEVVVI